MDYANRYPEAFSLRNTTAEKYCWSCFLFGVPEEILSDNGPNLTGTLMRVILASPYQAHQAHPLQTPNQWDVGEVASGKEGWGQVVTLRPVHLQGFTTHNHWILSFRTPLCKGGEGISCGLERDVDSIQENPKTGSGLHHAHPDQDDRLHGHSKFEGEESKRCFQESFDRHSSEDHLEIATKVLIIIKKAGLTVKPAKCKLSRKELEFLGHVIGCGQTKTQYCKVRPRSSAGQ